MPSHPSTVLRWELNCAIILYPPGAIKFPTGYGKDRHNNRWSKKTGGRQKGTPNKITALAKGMIEKWLETHNTIPEGDMAPLIMQDFLELDPKDRVKVSMEFIKIIMPRNISIDDNEIHLTMEDKLVELAGDEEDDEE